jgi:hypothetical protein
LASEDDHGETVDCGTMVVAGLHADSLCLDYTHIAINSVINHDLIDAFSNLSLSIIHITSTKAIDFIFVDHRGVSASPLNLLLRVYLFVCPVWTELDIQKAHLSVSIIILSSDEPSTVTAAAESGIFSGCWHPGFDG